MKNLTRHTKINFILIITVIVLAFIAIIGHHQIYLLYKKSLLIQQQNQHLTALQKQLKVRYSEQTSGKQTQIKAREILKMQRPTNPTTLRL